MKSSAEACPNEDMITTVADCQEANDLHAYGTTHAVSDQASAGYWPGCQTTITGTVNFNSNWTGIETTNVIYGLCRIGGTVGGCMQDSDCSSLTKYCVSGLCEEKTCDTNV
jgi:hypothetical protein